jgi:hypothetical protein
MIPFLLSFFLARSKCKLLRGRLNHGTILNHTSRVSTCPLARSSDLWSSNAGDEKISEFLRKLEKHANYLREILSIGLNAHDSYKIWMSKSTQDKLSHFERNLEQDGRLQWHALHGHNAGLCVLKTASHKFSGRRDIDL